MEKQMLAVEKASKEKDAVLDQLRMERDRLGDQLRQALSAVMRICLVTPA